MSYKTLDGYTLKEGDECFISLQCLTGKHNLSPNPRHAFYRNEDAKEYGWDFITKQGLKAICSAGDCGCEVIGVWKYYRKQEAI
jgi:hypothetical protein